MLLKPGHPSRHTRSTPNLSGRSRAVAAYCSSPCRRGRGHGLPRVLPRRATSAARELRSCVLLAMRRRERLRLYHRTAGEPTLTTACPPVGLEAGVRWSASARPRGLNTGEPMMDKQPDDWLKHGGGTTAQSPGETANAGRRP